MSKNGIAANVSKPHLLFVEDEITLREHLAERLSDQYDVDTAGTGTEALLAVMRTKPALVVTDIVMPDMDGVELLKTLRRTPGTQGIPVLLISGRAADEHRIEGFEHGADGFLSKPYTERELRALIGSMLRAAQLRVKHARRPSSRPWSNGRRSWKASRMPSTPWTGSGVSPT
jgi:DNA-binding response OmpR family regulator